MSTAAEDLALYLAAQGHGVVGASSGWSIHVAREPDEPDKTITLYDTAGQASDPDNNFYRPRVQVRTRANDYRDATAKMVAIRDELIDPRTGFTANGRIYLGAFAMSEPAGLGYDDHDRARVVLTFDLMLED